MCRALAPQPPARGTGRLCAHSTCSGPAGHSVMNMHHVRKRQALQILSDIEDTHTPDQENPQDPERLGEHGDMLAAKGRSRWTRVQPGCG